MLRVFVNQIQDIEYFCYNLPHLPYLARLCFQHFYEKEIEPHHLFSD